MATNEAWDAATEVRCASLAKFVQRKTPPTGAGALITAAITGVDQYGPSTKKPSEARRAREDTAKTTKEIVNSRTTVKRQTVPP